MGNLWGTPMTPQEMMQKSRKSLRTAVRNIEKEMERIQEREPEILYQMKDYARSNKGTAVKLLAKELIRLRAAENKLLAVKIQLESTQHQIESLSSTAAMTEAMKTAVRAMYAMNKQVDTQALQRIMMEFDKQSEFMEMKQELMNDTIDGAMTGDADEEEEEQMIAQATVEVDGKGKIQHDKVIARQEGDFPVIEPTNVNYTDVAPNQIASISASLIPFLEHDDANRALMGSNMQRQAVPLLKTEAPIVGTGMEAIVSRDAWECVKAKRAGTVEEANNCF